MKKKRFTESQIIKAIKEQDAGKDVVDICREMGIHRATLYNWKKKYGGMEVDQLSQFKELQRSCYNVII
jgi:putative transposase